MSLFSDMGFVEGDDLLGVTDFYETSSEMFASSEGKFIYNSILFVRFLTVIDASVAKM